MVKGLGSKQKAKKNARPDKHVQVDMVPNDYLKGKLINSLTVYLKKSGLKGNEDIISEANIMDFEREQNPSKVVCKCRFSCPFCPKTVSVKYKDFWMSSNATNHLKMHIKNNE